MGYSNKKAQASRDVVASCERVWLRPYEYEEADVLEALATLLAAYGLGSQSAKNALLNPGRCFKGWRLPPKHRALDMAADVVRLADELRGAA